MRSGVKRLIIGSTGTDIIITYGAQLTVIILGLLETVIVARILGAEGKGTVQVAQLLISEGAQILSFGASISMVYFVARREFPNALLAGSAIWVALLVGVPLVAAFVLLAPPLAYLFLPDQENGPIYIVLAAPIGIFLLLRSMLISLYRGSNCFWKYNYLTVVQKLFFLLAVVLLLVAYNGYIYSAILAFILADVLFCVLLIRLVSKEFGVSLAIEGSLIKRILTFNFVGHIGTVLQNLSYRLDVLIVALFLPTTQVGLYGVATSIGQLMWYLPNAIGVVLLSRTAADDRQKADERLVLTCQSLVIIMGLAGVVAWITGPTLIPLIFGKDFQGSIWPFTLLLPGIISLSFWKVLANDMTGRGRMVYKLYSAGPGAIATVILDFALIPRYGIAGAAVASSIAYSLTTAVIMLLTYQETRIAIWVLLIPDKRMFRMIFEQIVIIPKNWFFRSFRDHGSAA